MLNRACKQSAATKAKHFAFGIHGFYIHNIRSADISKYFWKTKAAFRTQDGLPNRSYFRINKHERHKRRHIRRLSI